MSVGELGHAFEVWLVDDQANGPRNIADDFRRLARSGQRCVLLLSTALVHGSGVFWPARSACRTQPDFAAAIPTHYYTDVIRLRDCANIAAAMDGVLVDGAGFTVRLNPAPLFASADFRTGWSFFVFFPSILASPDSSAMIPA